jgi:hypothetical protein
MRERAHIRCTLLRRLPPWESTENVTQTISMHFNNPDIHCLRAHTFPALTYNHINEATEAPHVNDLKYDSFCDPILTYNTVYSTLSATYDPEAMFIVPEALLSSRNVRFLKLYVRVLTPAMLPASTAPTKNGAFSMPFRCAASARS